MSKIWKIFKNLINEYILENLNNLFLSYEINE